METKTAPQPQEAARPQPGEPLMPPDVASESSYQQFLHGEGVAPGSEAEQHILEGRRLYKDAKARQEEASRGEEPASEPEVLESMLGDAGDRNQNDNIRIARTNELNKLHDEGQLVLKAGQAREIGARALNAGADSDPIQIHRQS